VPVAPLHAEGDGVLAGALQLGISNTCSTLISGARGAGHSVGGTLTTDTLVDTMLHDLCVA